MQEEYFITRLTAIFFSYLTAALLIERFVEVLIAILRYLELRQKRPKWFKIAETLQVRLERFYHLQSGGGARALDTLLWNLVTVVGDSGKRILAADLIRLRYYRLVSYALTFGAALILAFFIKYNLIEIIQQAFPEVKVLKPGEYYGLNVLLTAGALSFGVQPLHQLISRLEKRLEKKLQPGGAQ